ncbi:hypothetical protein Tco_0823484 [Tanacetum coccineum]|uniref:Uncharacterized protein n=1 Tax=Tanacetum coccineum TaxID=301880 RepID=A0ABQ5AI06_9ASTR
MAAGSRDPSTNACNRHIAQWVINVLTILDTRPNGDCLNGSANSQDRNVYPTVDAFQPAQEKCGKPSKATTSESLNIQEMSDNLFWRVLVTSPLTMEKQLKSLHIESASMMNEISEQFTVSTIASQCSISSTMITFTRMDQDFNNCSNNTSFAEVS